MHFAISATYTQQAIKALMASATDREAEARRTIESLGGRVLSWFVTPPTEATGGGWAAVVTYEVPDGDTQFALISMLQASGAFSSIRTHRLIPHDQFRQALRRAGDIGYTTPLSGRS